MNLPSVQALSLHCTHHGALEPWEVNSGCLLNLSYQMITTLSQSKTSIPTNFAICPDKNIVIFFLISATRSIFQGIKQSTESNLLTAFDSNSDQIFIDSVQLNLWRESNQPFFRKLQKL
jgi:hypothetical protein